MLKIIKSSYFESMLFSYINERQKLKIIKYNKSLQKIINISTVNYKYFNGKYIIYGSKREGREYDYYDKLEFEGD